MQQIRAQLGSRPALARVLPFIIFLGFTFCQGQFGEASRYWFYVAKTFAGAWMLWVIWPLISEMRWKISWEAVVVGVGVFVIWVGLDGWYPSVDELVQRFLCPVLKTVGLQSWCPEPKADSLLWNPHLQFGQGSAVAWFVIVVRILGSSIVVPPFEEVFYRSFLYRWIINPDFQSVGLGRFNMKAFIFTAVIFGFAHYEWLAGILCGFAYQGLVIRKKRLGDAMTAHAITNFLLGLWIVWRGAWNFW